MEQPTPTLLTILVVDDDFTILHLVEAILSRNDFQTLCAADGEAALRISQECAGPIHLLLTDIVMPKMDGITLARKFLKQRPQSAALLMSGHPDAELPPELPFLAKPFTTELLLLKVRQAMKPVPVCTAAERAASG